MPNWCDNRLTVEGDPEAVRAFVESVKSGDEPLSFERLVPTPPAATDDELAKRLGRNSAGDAKTNGMPDWYWWRVEHWGTKWDACDVRVPNEYQEGDKSMEYFLNTAWSPPEAWLRTVAAMFPTLRFTLSYVEEAMDFAGYLVCRGGESYEHEVTIPHKTEEQWEEGEHFWSDDIEVPADILPVGEGVTHRYRDEVMKLFGSLNATENG